MPVIIPPASAKVNLEQAANVLNGKQVLALPQARIPMRSMSGRMNLICLISVGRKIHYDPKRTTGKRVMV